MVNRYGQMAQNHWRQWLPGRYAQITDPDSFFASLGEEAQTRIQDLMMDLAGDDPPGEGYLAKTARLNTARLEAENQVIRETAPARTRTAAIRRTSRCRRPAIQPQDSPA